MIGGHVERIAGVLNQARGGGHQLISAKVVENQAGEVGDAARGVHAATQGAGPEDGAQIDFARKGGVQAVVHTLGLNLDREGDARLDDGRRLDGEVHLGSRNGQRR